MAERQVPQAEIFARLSAGSSSPDVSRNVPSNAPGREREATDIRACSSAISQHRGDIISEHFRQYHEGAVVIDPSDLDVGVLQGLALLLCVLPPPAI